MEHQKQSIRFYNDREVRAVWSEEGSKWLFSVLVPSLTYSGMDVGNGVQAYIAYLNYDSQEPTFDILNTKAERREALRLYCQQDTWAMVEILRAVREKIEGHINEK